MVRRSPVALPVLIGLTGLGLLVAPPASAMSPTAVMGAFFDRANAVLHGADPARGVEEPRRAIRLLVNEMFDFREAAALALGPVWRSRTPREQEEFARLFGDFLERGYIATMSSRASVVGGVTVQYLAESVAGEAAIVPTRMLTRSGGELPVDYRMVRSGERWAVRDVVVDGVSLVANYRAQFSRFLSTSSFSDLVARMRGERPEGAAGVGVAAAPASAVVQAGPRAEAPGRSQRSGEPTATPVMVPVVALASALAAPAAAVPAAAASAPPPSAMPSPPISPPAAPSRAARPEPLVTARVAEESPPGRASAKAKEPAPPAKTEPPVKRSAAGLSYWVQVGAFKTMDAANHLAETLRPQVAAISSRPAPEGQASGMLARVRLGPYSTRAEAAAKLRELHSRGYQAFIAPD